MSEQDEMVTARRGDLETAIGNAAWRGFILGDTPQAQTDLVEQCKAIRDELLATLPTTPSIEAAAESEARAWLAMPEVLDTLRAMDPNTVNQAIAQQARHFATWFEYDRRKWAFVDAARRVVDAALTPPAQPNAEPSQ